MSQGSVTISSGGELMSAADTIYKVSLALKNRDSRIQVDLKDMLEDLAGAKDEYNALNKQGHRMLLLEPTRKRIYLLFKPAEMQDFQQIMLDFFAKILKEDFDWQDYCSSDGALFEIKIVQAVDAGEYGHLLKQVQKGQGNSNLGDPELEKQLSKNKRQITTDRPRLILNDEKAKEPEASLEETLKQVEELVGLEGFKQEIKQIVAYTSQIQKEGLAVTAREAFPYHYL